MCHPCSVRNMRRKRLNTQTETTQLRFQSQDLNPSLPDLLPHMAYVLQHLLEATCQETGACLIYTELGNACKQDTFKSS